MRSRRCNKCQESFYSLTDVTTCQNCTESHDPIPQATRDAEALAQANPPVTTALPQSVDPRGPAVPEDTQVKPEPQVDAIETTETEQTSAKPDPTPPAEPPKPQAPRKKTVKAPAVPAENPK